MIHAGAQPLALIDDITSLVLLTTLSFLLLDGALCAFLFLHGGVLVKQLRRHELDEA